MSGKAAHGEVIISKGGGVDCGLYKKFQLSLLESVVHILY